MANILSYDNTAATSATITITGSQWLDILASTRATGFPGAQFQIDIERKDSGGNWTVVDTINNRIPSSVFIGVGDIRFARRAGGASVSLDVVTVDA